MEENEYKDFDLLNKLSKRRAEIKSKLTDNQTTNNEKIALQRELAFVGSRLFKELRKPTHPNKSQELKNRLRNEKIIMDLVLRVKELFDLRDNAKDMLERDYFQQEIDSLYKIIYEELKKKSIYFLNVTPKTTKRKNGKNIKDIKDTQRIIDNIVTEWSIENFKQFSVTYPIRDFYPTERKDKLISVLLAFFGIIVGFITYYILVQVGIL